MQWILGWTGKFQVTESVPGFRNCFLSFVAADLGLILAAFLMGVLILLENPKAILFGVALGSAMLFFGLYSLMYDLNSRFLFNFSADEWFGKAVTIYKIIAGFLLMFLSWKDG